MLDQSIFFCLLLYFFQAEEEIAKIDEGIKVLRRILTEAQEVGRFSTFKQGLKYLPGGHQHIYKKAQSNI